ncbi:hypothetical protein B566_EDAN017314 [Ephemera danica]|nr:hypothetical protein B566_EDAN017314 [Ephemera danica]
MNFTHEMSLQVGGLCFILLCSFLVASTLGENISSEEVKIDEWQTLTLLCNATEVPGATVLWIREDTRNITRLKSGEEFETVKEGANPAITLVNSSKYLVEETQQNEYTTLMKLTIRNFQRADYAIYSCSSSANPAITLVNSSKYLVEETQQNEYTTLMKLTIRNFQRADYAIYSCSSIKL